MKRDHMKAMLGAVGRYIRRSFEPRIKAVEDQVAEVPALVEKFTDAVATDAAKHLLASEGLKSLCVLVATEAVAELPPAEKGEDGKSVTVEEVVAKLLPALEDRFEAIVGKHVLDVERRAQGVLERAVAAIPKPRDGVDGKDGLSAEDFTGEYDPDRGFVVRARSGEKAVEFVLPMYVHRGFWSEGKAVKAGESATHDGALWIAKRETTAKPCLENAEDWILAARKGRDGKDGRHGVDKTAAVKVASDA